MMISFVDSICRHETVIKKDISFLFVCSILICAISSLLFMKWDIIINSLYYFVYFIAATFISKRVEAKKLLMMINSFCLVHLGCIFLQVFYSEIYIKTILPLLPIDVHKDIIDQMNYNNSYYGFSIQTSVTAMYLSIGAIITATFARNSKSVIRKEVSALLTVVYIIGVLFTTRRGSLAALLLVLAFIYFDTKKGKLSKTLLLFAGIVFLATIGIEQIPGMSTIISKMNKLSGNMLNGRETIWAMAIEGFFNHPFFGIGIGKASISSSGYSVDNAYLSMLLERGIIGTVIYFVPCIIILYKTIVNRREKTECLYDDAISNSYYIQLLFLMMSFVENYYNQALTMFFFYLLITMRSVEEPKDGLHEE